MQQFIPLELLSYFLIFQTDFSKQNFVYFQGYLWGLLLTGGRKTMNNIAHCCFWIDRNLSSWERFLSDNLWDMNAVGNTLLQLLLEKLEDNLKLHGSYLACVDTLLIPKNGTRMSGVQKWHDHSGNANRGEQLKGHHWAILGLISYDKTSQRYWCWVTKMRLISGNLNPFQFIVNEDGEARRANFWDGVIPLILELKKSLGLNSLRVVVDAYFSKVPFLSPLVAKGIHVISRMRKDAVAWDKIIENKSKQSFKLDGKWKLVNLLKEFKPQLLSVKIYGKSTQIEAVEREVYIRGFQPKVKVVVVQGAKEPIIFLSTDLTLTALQIIEIYGSRFSIELAIRDLKQQFGLGDYQCYLGIAIDRFVQLACVAYCLFRLFQIKEIEQSWMPKVSASFSPFSFSRLRRGLQHFAIAQVLGQKSAPEADLASCTRELDQILRLAA
jgi:hypothetical protein